MNVYISELIDTHTILYILDQISAKMMGLLWTFCGIKCIMKEKIVISKSAESLRRKAIGPVKWQPVATFEMHCLNGQYFFCLYGDLLK